MTGERSKQMSDFMVKYQTKEKELEIAHLKEKQSRRLLYYIISWFVIYYLSFIELLEIR